MARILDVAAEVRRSQNELEREFRRDEARAELRKRLAAIGDRTGSPLSEEQLDAAIVWYYDNLHRYRRPEPSFGVFLAHLYVRRGLVFLVLIVIAVVAATLWWLLS